MIELADIHAQSGRLALRRSDRSGREWLELRTLAGQGLGEIAHEFLALMPHWSPDGASLAFGSNDGRLYIYRLGEAAPQVVFSDPALTAGFCEWSPAGNQLVFSAYSRAAQLAPNIYTLDVPSGRTMQLTDAARMVDRFPHWSPSGQWVAFKRQDLDEPEIPPRIYILDPQTRQCFPILNTDGGYSHTGRHAWRSDSSALLVTHGDSAGVELRAIRPSDQATTWRYESPTLQDGVFLPRGDGLVCICADELLWFEYPSGQLKQRLSLAAFAAVRQYFSGPQLGFAPDPSVMYFLGRNSCLYRWTLGGECVCVLEERSEPRPAYPHDAYTVLSRDARPIPVQRFIPPQPKGPAILYVHGGPGGVIDPDDPFMLRLLAAGIEFICVAYRGTIGYGREHENANRGEYGRADVWDVIATGLDWKNRLGKDRPLILAGYSYGGFLTLLSLAQAGQPFAGGISLWAVSGLHRMLAHQHKAFPAEAAERTQALIERSPLEQAKRIHVPLLILHGALDTAATTEEMQIIHDGVVAAGGECELIVYADDTHGLQRHRDDIHARVLAFVEQLDAPGALDDRV
jgi:dipeptidyl aminopeptidase/acylaminoacyl peptidase